MQKKKAVETIDKILSLKKQTQSTPLLASGNPPEPVRLFQKFQSVSPELFTEIFLQHSASPSASVPSCPVSHSPTVPIPTHENQSTKTITLQNQ
ncbi:hypothetical protein NPIL_456501 [Nephila pilipes]|uniref:Uncharacterized protein n=1 Tax=Nephila pilipes TaxID=299642 RepID=A0A8X6PXI5_NEPPI|nr:hypothetical protein NPIL_456501 [Nephila pilipes]